MGPDKTGHFRTLLGWEAWEGVGDTMAGEWKLDAKTQRRDAAATFGLETIVDELVIMLLLFRLSGQEYRPAALFQHGNTVLKTYKRRAIHVGWRNRAIALDEKDCRPDDKLRI